MKKEDFKVYQNEFKMTDSDKIDNVLTESRFMIEVTEDSETEKELLEYLKKANPEHHFLNSPELEDRNPTVFIEAKKEYWGNDYQGSELYSANFYVAVDKPIHNTLTAFADYGLPEFDEIKRVLGEVMTDYEQEYYQKISEKYADIKVIDIQTEVETDNNGFDSDGHYSKDNYDVRIDEVIFKPQPDGMVKRTFIDGNPYADDKTVDSVTVEEMEAEIQSALHDNAIISVTTMEDKNPISYQDWEANQHLKEIQQEGNDLT